MDNQNVKTIVTETIEKNLPTIVEAINDNVDAKMKATNEAIDAKVAELKTASASELENIKAELKKIAFSGKSTPASEELSRKTVIVDTIKNVALWRMDFESAFEASVKTMTEGTATEGAELVFDQFDTDVVRIINTFDIVNDVRILPITKGDKISLPKMTNWVVTYFTAEEVAYTASEPATAFISIDIAKMTTLVSMTEELLDDTMTVPDLYDLIVEFVAESQAEFLETQILTGTGSVKGILVNAWINVVSLAATETLADVTDDDIVAVIGKAARKFKRGNVKWYMSQYVMTHLMSLKTSDWYPLYPELRNPTPTLMWKPIVLSDEWFAQDSATDVALKPLLAYGDLRYFTYVRRRGLTTERGYFASNWASDIVSLKSSQRGWGTLTFPEAITVLRNWAAS